MQCPNCGGSMSVNENKKPGTKAPDFICDDETCVTEQGYRSGAWKPKTGGFRGAVVNAKQPAIPQSVWEAKERLSAMQTSFNAASTVYQGTGEVEKVIEAARKFYSLLRQAKQGIMAEPKIPIQQKQPQSVVGKKIQEAMPEESEEEAIDVSMIPF